MTENTETDERYNGMRVWKDETNKVSVSPTFSHFPMDNWIEWEQDCKLNYDDRRWFKAHNDHLKAKDSDIHAVIFKRIEEQNLEIEALKTLIIELKAKPETKTKKKTVKLLDGEMEAD